MAYKTQPGTIPHRVVEWFKTQPAGIERTLVQVAEAAGLDQDTATINTCLRPARFAGVLKSRRVEGQLSHLWSLGDGTPVDDRSPDVLAHDAAVDGGKPEEVKRVIQAHSSLDRRPSQAFGRDWERGVGLRTPAGHASEPPSEFDFLVRRNGTLEIWGVEIAEGGLVKLTPQQFAELSRFAASGFRPKLDSSTA